MKHSIFVSLGMLLLFAVLSACSPPSDSQRVAESDAAWANTKALELAGVTEDEEPIDFFGKDADGSRNGYVGTAAAAYYMMGVAGLKQEAVLESAPEILELIASNGITHMFEAGQPPGHEEPLFNAIGQLEGEGKLTSRYTVSCMVQRQQHIQGAIEIHAAVTRSLVGESEVLGRESEKLTVDEAIRAYTLDAAYMVRAENHSGSLEVGKLADFIVLDRNLFEIPEDDIIDTKVLQTVVDGRVVFERGTMN